MGIAYERRHEGNHEPRETTEVGQKRKCDRPTATTNSSRKRNSSRNWSPPVLKRTKKEEFLKNIAAKMRYHTIVASNNDVPEEYKIAVTKLHDMLRAHGESIYDVQDHPVWNLEPTPVVGTTGGVCWGRFTGFFRRTKIGSAMHCKMRVEEQPLCSSATVMTLERIYQVLDDKLVASIARMGLPSLHYHPERTMELKRTISLQVAEGIIGCGYRNDCGIFFEKLVQL